VIARAPQRDGGSPSSHAHPWFLSGELPLPPLVPLANQPLLVHALDWLADAGVTATAIIVNEQMADAVREEVQGRPPGMELHWLELIPTEGLEDSLEWLDGFLAGDSCILHLADSLSRQGLRRLVAMPEALHNEAIFLTHGAVQSTSGVIDLGARRGSAGWRLDELARSRLGGVCVLGADAAAAAVTAALAPGGELRAAAARVRRMGGQVRALYVEEWWRHEPTLEALLEGNCFALDDLQPDHDGASIVNSCLQGAVVAHPTARLESSTVRGPAIIGEHAYLRDAYVGPYTSIGAGVDIEGSEIEHSVILPEASISHVGGRLEASVVGSRARIFRDFRLPRALRLNIGAGAEISLM
jgi:glucose-1-phosphate thymidylyltransferase